MTTKTRKPRPSKKAESNGKPSLSGGEILTLAEAAAFLRVSEDGLKADAVGGKVPGRLVAGEWRFNRAALLCWLGHFEIKSFPSGPEPKLKSSKEQLLALAGMWKDDPTVDAMVEEIYRQRKLYPVGGS
jgi:hypothetical protein